MELNSLDYVSNRIALILKLLGYDKETVFWYFITKDLKISSSPNIGKIENTNSLARNWNDEDMKVSAPFHESIIKEYFNRFNLSIEVTTADNGWGCDVYKCEANPDFDPTLYDNERYTDEECVYGNLELLTISDYICDESTKDVPMQDYMNMIRYKAKEIGIFTCILYRYFLDKNGEEPDYSEVIPYSLREANTPEEAMDAFINYLTDKKDKKDKKSKDSVKPLSLSQEENDGKW